MGALLFGSGLLVLNSSKNLEFYSWVKLILNFATLASALVALFLWRKVPFKRECCLAIITVLFYPILHLVSSEYQIQSAGYQKALTFSLLTLPLAVLAKEIFVPLAFVFSLALGLFFGTGKIEILELVFRDNEYAFYLSIGLISLAAALVIKENSRILALKKALYVGAFTCLASYLFIVEIFYDYYVNLWAWAVPFELALLCSALIFYRLRLSKNSSVLAHSILVLLLCTAVPNLLKSISFHVFGYFALTIFLLVSVLAVFEKNTQLFLWGMILLVTKAIVFSFLSLEDFLTRGFFLMVISFVFTSLLIIFLKKKKLDSVLFY